MFETKKKLVPAISVLALLSACGGGGGGGGGNNEPSINSEIYFSSNPVAEINVNEAEACFGSLLSVIDMDSDGQKDIAAHYWCNQFEVAEGFNGSTPDTYKVFLNKNGKYELGNLSLFGQSIISLGGASRKVVQSDFNGDGKLDLAYAINREDGRPIGDNVSVAAAKSMLVTSSNAGYRLDAVGVEDWFHTLDVYQVDSLKKSIVLNGFNNIGPQGFELSNQAWIVSTAALPQLSGLTYKFIKTSPTLTFDDAVVTGGLNDASGLDIWLKNNGGWTAGVGYVPNFSKNSVPMITWNGDAILANRVDIDGRSYTGAGFDESCKLKMTPSSKEIYIGRFSGRRLPLSYNGEEVQETSLPLYYELMAFEIADGGLQKIQLDLSEPLGQESFNFFDCADVNGDGYDDIVISTQAIGGKPEVYLNSKSNKFNKVPASYFPSAFGVLSRSKLEDVDGDGIVDLVVFTTFRSPQQIRVFKGIKEGVQNFV